jgi:Leucine-rich repeat (LRR) protein
MNDIEFLSGERGIKAVLHTEWRESFLDILLEKQTMELELNDGKGWFGKTIEFLKELPQLKSLIILRLPLESIEPVHYLSNLIDLQLSTYSDVPVNFDAFPKLENCGFEWIKGSESLFESKSLKRLGLNRFKKKSSQLFSKLENLERLTLLNSGLEELSGIFKLRKLMSLGLVNLSRVRSVVGIEKLVDLKELEIQRCRNINSVSELFELSNLKRLLLIDSGNIESIQGIEKLTELEEFLFYESTNIVDGDVSPIKSMKNLRTVSFQKALFMSSPEVH